METKDMVVDDGAVFASMEDFGQCSNFEDFLEEIGSTVHKASIFPALDEEEVMCLARSMQCYKVPQGRVLFREGDKGGFMILVLSGRLEGRKHSPEGEKTIVNLDAGSTLGEMSLLDGEPRCGTCVALEPSTLAVLTRGALEHLMLQQPRLGTKLLMQFALTMSGRLRHAFSDLTEHLVHTN
jgi:CRP/FNR family transcriptional regulator, cyclic AMP receptor protein